MVLSLTDITQKYTDKLKPRHRSRRSLDEHLYQFKRDFAGQENALENLAVGVTDLLYGLATKSINVEDISETLEPYGWQKKFPTDDCRFLLEGEQISMRPFDFWRDNRTLSSIHIEATYKGHRCDNSRKIFLKHKDISPAQIIIYKLGMEPKPNYSFGINIIVPNKIERLLWAAFTDYPIRDLFNSPDDTYRKVWITKPPEYPFNGTPWARTIIGLEDTSFGSSTNGKLFLVTPFDANVSDVNNEQSENKNCSSLISYFQL